MNIQEKKIAEIINFQLATELCFGEFVGNRQASSELVQIIERLAMALADGLSIEKKEKFVKLSTKHYK
jgi:hypothetical protein